MFADVAHHSCRRKISMVYTSYGKQPLPSALFGTTALNVSQCLARLCRLQLHRCVWHDCAALEPHLPAVSGTIVQLCHLWQCLARLCSFAPPLQCLGGLLFAGLQQAILAVRCTHACPQARTQSGEHALFVRFLLRFYLPARVNHWEVLAILGVSS